MKVVLFTLQIVGIFCSNNAKISNEFPNVFTSLLGLVKERIRQLEDRVSSETELIHEDYTEIIYRLDDIERVLNISLDQRKVSYNNVSQDTSETNSEAFEHLKQDFTRIRTEFSEEKAKVSKIRRELSRLGRDLKTVKEDVDKHCKITLNMTNTVISQIEETKQLVISEVSEKQYTFLNEINETSAHDNELLKDITSQLEQVKMKTFVIERKANTDSVKIHNIEVNMEHMLSFLKDLSSNFEELLRNVSCADIKTKSYSLRNGTDVNLDQITDSDGWTVFQRRLNGEVDFYRNWTEYKNGFGDIDGEFWLGNDLLSAMTANGNHELRIEIQDFDGNKAHAKYSKFKIYPEQDKYQLEVSGYSGTAGDSLKYHNGMKFTTFDSDNDKRLLNCAAECHGAWWYNDCFFSNLNGQYYNETGKTDFTGIVWFFRKNNNYGLKKVEMKFR